jgi:hypothetical protein
VNVSVFVAFETPVIVERILRYDSKDILSRYILSDVFPTRQEGTADIAGSGRRCTEREQVIR